MKNNQIVESICGTKPSGTEDIIIGNDPNFIFKNDLDFGTVILYDIEGNIINVNSWIECAHYVRGGWNNNSNLSSVDEEFIFLLFLIGFSTVTYFFLTLFKKRKFYVKS
tara:strand:+ start:118 stop:444 length:327 start_codon:yes stop_codon:yes gene_type:complete